MGIVLVLAREGLLHPLCLCMGQPEVILEADLVGGNVEDILELGKFAALSDLIFELGRQDVDKHFAQGGVVNVVPHTTSHTQPFTHVNAQIFQVRADREVDEGTNTLCSTLQCTAGVFMIYYSPEFETIILFATCESCSARMHIIVEYMAYEGPEVIGQEHEIVAPKAVDPTILNGCPGDPSRRRPDHVQQSAPPSVACLSMVMESVYPPLVC